MTDTRYRVEASTRGDEIETGLQARIGDALWMLARQWQVGEFRGEDAASPVLARYQMRTLMVNGFRSFRDSTFAPIDSQIPLEAYAEQQKPHPLAAFWRSAEAGQHLLQMLSAAGLEPLRDPLRQQSPLQPPAQVDPTEQAWVNLLVRRGCDGDTIYQNRARLAQAVRGHLTPDQQAALAALFKAWIDWYEDRIFSQRDLDCWDLERMEYKFQVGAGAVALEASEYPGGHLDWFSFDRVSASGTIAQPPQVNDPKTVLPSPVRFAGMAAQRFWEFEDGTVNFGALSNNPADFAGMITAAFATTYGDDWYVIPVRVPIGSLAKINSLEVLDSFGDTQTIPSIASLDGAGRVWRYFELKGDDAEPLLFVPAVALGRVEGGALKSVDLIRDDTENLAWGIERSYEGVLERSIDRLRQWTVTAQPAAEDSDDRWRYHLLNPVPPNWIPFIPLAIGDSAQIRLKRGRMAEWELLPPNSVGIRGVTLLPNPAKPLNLFEEEVPSSGVTITHAYQVARNPAGRSFLWLGRRKQPAGKLTPINRETDEIDR